MKTHRNHQGVKRRVASVARISLVVIVFGALGLSLLTRSQAATYAVTAQAESGTLAGNAVAVTNASASAGSAVQFGGITIEPRIVGRQLQKGNTGQRLKMDGVTVWGIKDQVTGDFGAGQYTNRQTIINAIKASGANHVRFRILADDYNNQRYMTKAQYLQQIKQWRDLTTAAGMYFMPIWWDGLDGAYSKGNWGTQYGQAFQMMTDVVNTLGKDPMVIYEPFNEPTDAPSDTQWLTAMKATVNHFRTDLGYTGLLVIDMRVWSHCYNDGNMTALENYDAGLTGMGGKNQLVFAKHDYANEGYGNPDGGFDSGHWLPNGCNWDPGKHLTWETEFGNYNGDPSTQHLAWSNGAATYFADRVNDGTLVGASAFLWGPWYDANAMTGNDNTTLTTWGNYGVNNLLKRVN